MEAIKRFRKFVRPAASDECWIWLGGQDRVGYGMFWVAEHGRRIRAHRFSYEWFNGKIPNGLLVLHRCDRRNCVNPDHLFLGTHADNMADMVAKGRSTKGRRPPWAKLTEGQALEILNYEGPQVDMARKFKVSEAMVSRIKNGSRWSHLRAA